MFKLFTVISIIVIDQMSKAWAVLNLKEQANFTLIPNVLELSYRENTGIAFSMFHDRPELLTMFNSLVILLLIVWTIKQTGSNFGLLFIIAGGLGNLIDRFVHGYVIDFINPIFVNFAVFNVADVALNVGVFLLIWDNLSKAKK